MSSNSMHHVLVKYKEVKGSVAVDFSPFLPLDLLAANCKPLILFSL